MILGLDPGISAKNATGVALFNPLLRRMVAADIVRRNPALDGLRAELEIADRVTSWVDAHAREIKVVVVEWPQVYPDERKVNPNTALLPLCGIVGAVCGILGRSPATIVYRPREWKGTVKGDVFTQRIYDRLDAAEKKIIDAVQPAGLRHNAIDAAGLVLKYLGRLERARVVHTESRT